MPEIASLHIDTIPFTDSAPSLAMTEHTPVIASGGTAVAKEMDLEWSVAIPRSDIGTNA